MFVNNTKKKGSKKNLFDLLLKQVFFIMHKLIFTIKLIEAYYLINLSHHISFYFNSIVKFIDLIIKTSLLFFVYD
jgi:hypothetical protein